MKHDCDAVLLLLSLPACLVLFFFCHLVLLKAKADSTRLDNNSHMHQRQTFHPCNLLRHTTRTAEEDPDG